MADVKWIKITTDIFDDEKIVLIEAMPESDSLIVIWFKLLCLAGKQNNSGVFLMNDRIAYTDEMLATIFRRKITTVKLALDTFETFGMIERINGTITIPNWDKHQSLDTLNKDRERRKLHMREVRAKQKALCDGNSDVTVTSRDVIEVEEKRIEQNRKEKIVEVDDTASPTLSQIKEFCSERKSNIDAEKFFYTYEQKGWENVPSWKAKVIDWEKHEKGTNKNNSSTNRFTRCSQREYSEEEMQELERKLLGG